MQTIRLLISVIQGLENNIRGCVITYVCGEMNIHYLDTPIHMNGILNCKECLESPGMFNVYIY